MNKKGFTLIELLVVIAIIGILASIVLVSLGSARNKAKDARITADLSQIRSIAEMIADDETTGYTSLCDPVGPPVNTLDENHATYSSQIGTIETDITGQGGAAVCFAGASAYCVSSILNVAGGYCVDSTGWAGSSATAVCTVANVCTH